MSDVPAKNLLLIRAEANTNSNGEQIINFFGYNIKRLETCIISDNELMKYVINPVTSDSEVNISVFADGEEKNKVNNLYYVGQYLEYYLFVDFTGRLMALTIYEVQRLESRYNFVNGSIVSKDNRGYTNTYFRANRSDQKIDLYDIIDNSTKSEQMWNAAVDTYNAESDGLIREVDLSNKADKVTMIKLIYIARFSRAMENGRKFVRENGLTQNNEDQEARYKVWADYTYWIMNRYSLWGNNYGISNQLTSLLGDYEQLSITKGKTLSIKDLSEGIPFATTKYNGSKVVMKLNVDENGGGSLIFLSEDKNLRPNPYDYNRAKLVYNFNRIDFKLNPDGSLHADFFIDPVEFDEMGFIMSIDSSRDSQYSLLFSPYQTDSTVINGDIGTLKFLTEFTNTNDIYLSKYKRASFDRTKCVDDLLKLRMQAFKEKEENKFTENKDFYNIDTDTFIRIMEMFNCEDADVRESEDNYRIEQLNRYDFCIIADAKYYSEETKQEISTFSKVVKLFKNGKLYKKYKLPDYSTVSNNFLIDADIIEKNNTLMSFSLCKEYVDLAYQNIDEYNNKSLITLDRHYYNDSILRKFLDYYKDFNVTGNLSSILQLVQDQFTGIHYAAFRVAVPNNTFIGIRNDNENSNSEVYLKALAFDNIDNAKKFFRFLNENVNSDMKVVVRHLIRTLRLEGNNPDNKIARENIDCWLKDKEHDVFLDMFIATMYGESTREVLNRYFGNNFDKQYGIISK